MTTTKKMRPQPRWWDYLLGLLVLYSLFSCSTPSTDEIVLIIDKTSESTMAQIERDQILDYALYKVLDLNEGDLKRKGLKVTISSFGSTSIQYTKTVTLAKGGGFLSRTEGERAKAIEDFKFQCHAQIERITQAHKGMEHTEIFQNLCGHLTSLSASNAEQKALICWSDMLHNTEQLSFYRYARQPNHILENYETLAAKIDHLCLLPSLSEIRMEIIHLPDEQTDKLFQASKTFWTQYLEDYGAEILFRPNI